MEPLCHFRDQLQRFNSMLFYYGVNLIKIEILANLVRGFPI